MNAPGITYRFLYQIDTAGPTLEILSRQASTSGSSAQLNLTLVGIPNNKIFVLTNLTVRATPGTAQQVTRLACFGTTQARLAFNIVEQTKVAVDLEVVTMDWQGEVWLQGRGQDDTNLTINAIFDGGANSNAVNAGFHGFVIPRANVAAF